MDDAAGETDPPEPGRIAHGRATMGGDEPSGEAGSMGFDDIAWLPLCAGLTVIGVILAWTATRRRGSAAGMRVLAWALLPMAAYLTGAVAVVWEVGSAIVRWVTGFAFSPTRWAGVVVAIVAVLLFFIAGALRSRAISRGRKARSDELSGGPPSLPGRKTPARAKTSSDDEFSEVEEILKRRGIS